MRSIRTRLLLVTMAAILVCVLSIGSMAIYFIRLEGERDSDRELKLLCENKCKTLDEYLNSIEQSVNLISGYTQELLGGTESAEEKSDEANPEGNSESARNDLTAASLQRYSEQLNVLCRSAAGDTNGIEACYYQFDPDIGGTGYGYLYTKAEDGSFVGREMAEMTAQDLNNSEQYGWYSVPREQGRACWLAPYDKESLGMKVISYVMPIYLADRFIGVIGMDIGYDTMVSQIRGITIYETGYAFLADENGRAIYHPSAPIGTQLMSFSPGMVEELRAASEERSKDITLAQYVRDGKEEKGAKGVLNNGMILIVTAPTSEIYATWQRLIQMIIVSALAIILIFAIIIIAVTKRITDPLKRLTAASRQLAEGNYDVKLEYTGNDEVGILTKAFQHLVDHLNSYISDLNSKAFMDALTGVKNKGAFDAFAHKLDEQIRQAGPENRPEFAVAMFDCNELKTMNDVYGHSRGDAYLCNACKMICWVFSHSPVFRLGGDEFAVLLTEDDYRDRDALFASFHEAVAEVNRKARNPWDRVNLAGGMATYEHGTDKNVNDVLKRADEQMYRNKAEYKKSRL